MMYAFVLLLLLSSSIMMIQPAAAAFFGVAKPSNRRRALLPLSSSTTDDETTTSAATLRSMTFRRLDKSQEPQLLCDFLMEIGACSTSITDSDKDTDKEMAIFAEPGDDPWEDTAAVVCGDHAVGRNVWNHCDVVAHFPASSDLGLVAELVEESLEIKLNYNEVEQVPDRDWVIHVQQSWHPILVEGILLRFPWHTDEDVAKIVGTTNPENVVQLELEGGVAFGTGEHPTTQLCLGWVQKIVQDENNNVSLLMDYGAGSGVLGLAACAFQHGLKAVGVDIDVDAVRIANVNAETNQLNMKNYLPPLDTTEGDDESKSVLMKAYATKKENELPSELNGDMYDAVVANILAGPLTTLAPTLASFLKTGGHLGLSGILAPQADMVVAAYEDYFSDISVSEALGGWVLISMRRK